MKDKTGPAGCNHINTKWSIIGRFPPGTNEEPRLNSRGYYEEPPLNSRGCLSVRGFYYWLAFGMCWVLACGVLSAAGQATEKNSQKIIRKVRIEGNEAVVDSEIMANIRSRSGSVLNEKLVSEDARRIIIMPEIYDVQWKIVSEGDQVDIIFTVAESPKIQAVSILGNKNIKIKKLAKELKFKEGDFLDRYLVTLGAESLADLYHEKGYYFATVELNKNILAQEKKVEYAIVEGPRLRVKKISFVGNNNIARRKLAGKAKTKAYFPIFRKGRLDDSQLEQDCLALTSYYHEEGFLNARVFVQKQFNSEKTRVTVQFFIEEGVKYHIASVRFEGNRILSREKLLDTVTLKPGQILTQKRQTFAKRAVERAYGSDGYIYSAVNLDVQYTDHEGEVDAVFKIEENEQYMLSRLIVRGNYETKDKVIRRDFDRHGFLPGGVYNTNASDRAKRRLSGKGLFENVTVTPIGTAVGERDALVEVTEARTGLLMFGVGVDTNSGIMGQISLEQRNFDASNWPQSLSEFLRGESFVGGGQRLRIDFYPGTRVTRGRINFHEPYLFDQPYYLDLNLFMFRRWRESYLERRNGATVTIGHRFKNDWSLDGSIRLEKVNISDLDDYGDVSSLWGSVWEDYLYDQNIQSITEAPEDVQEVEGSNFLTSLKVGVGCDTTDRMFKPTEGHKLHLSWEQVGALGGEFSYAAVSTGGTLYKTVYMDITERRTVWAGQVRGSKIIHDAPVFERYYAGGIGSMRGFDYRGVSPRGGIEDDPIGSEYILLAGTELTHPLFEETLYGKIFCDSGLVSEGPYRVSVGFGIELIVPQLFQMVPMQFDFGFPIFQDDKDEKERFSFTFGMTF